MRQRQKQKIEQKPIQKLYLSIRGNVLSFSKSELEEFLEEFLNTSFVVDKDALPFDEENPVERITYKESISLTDYLLNQLEEENLEQDEYEIGRKIIESINYKGYLLTLPDKIIKENKFDKEKFKKVLGIIKGFDPGGVGASDMYEALFIQLKDKAPEFDKPIYYKLIREELENLAHNRFDKIIKNLKLKKEDLLKVKEIIKKLKPIPAADFITDEAGYIFPDVVIKKENGEFEISLPGKTNKNIIISNFYKKMYQENKDLEEIIKYEIEKAIAIKRSLEERENILYKLSELFLNERRKFFEENTPFAPLYIDEVSKKIGYSDSTVYRIIKNKYIDTPFKIMPLSDFIVSGSEGLKDDIISAIKGIIDKEDKAHPLSDEEITEELNKKKFNIKRRTVAKYREEALIPAKRDRKEKQL